MTDLDKYDIHDNYENNKEMVFVIISLTEFHYLCWVNVCVEWLIH